MYDVLLSASAKKQSWLIRKEIIGNIQKRENVNAYKLYKK